MVYVCKICNCTFLDLQKYQRHLNNKTTCDPIKKEELKINKLTCQYCKKILSSKTRLNGHIEICKEKQGQMSQMIELLVEKIEKQDKQNEILNEKIDQLMNKESKTININNTVNQQQNIFNIVPFGEEKFDYITDKEYVPNESMFF